MELKPFLKWAGGKRQLLKDIRELYPENIDTYYEPFLGGGAVFFDLKPQNYIISDSNPELINLYKMISSQPTKIISELKKMKYNKEFFYKIREQNFDKISKIKAAARMLYLNRTCFNGLYRVNKEGNFNVPFGKYKNPDFVQEKLLKNVSKFLKNNSIKCLDFKKILDFNPNKKDFIFFDPPYVPLEGYSDFKRYTKEQFYESHHIKLANIFKKLVKNKIRIVLTNSNSDLVHNLYKDFDKIILDTQRNINSNPNKRQSQDVIIYANI